MRGVVPPIWFTSRAIGVLLALAFVLALASVERPLLAVWYGCVAIFVAALAADAALGPTRTTVRVTRRPLTPLALARAATIEYDVVNRARIPIVVGLIETPVGIVDFAEGVVRANVPARSQVVATLACVPRDRGLARFGAVYAWAENRVGLLRRRYRADADDEARVMPDFAAVEGYGSLAKRRTLLEAGLRRLRLRGAGNEFESLREYAPGDGFRLVDWKATARRGRMMVAQYDVERSQNVIVALDCGRLMTARAGNARKIDYAVTAALSVLRVAEAASDNVGLVAFAARPLVDVAPRRGAAHYRALARASYDLQARAEEPDYETVFTGLRRRQSKRSLFIVFTDIFDPVTSAAILAAAGALVPRHVVVCVLMNDAAIESALAVEPVTPRDAYRTSVAMTLADERATSIAILRGRGVIVIDVPAPRLTVALIDAYLDIKERGLI